MPDIFARNVAAKLSQGDVFLGINIHERLSNEPMRTSSRPLLLLSHGCEIDKTNVDVFLVCVIRLLTELSDGQPNQVRTGQIRSAMYLEDVPQVGEAFADFRYFFRVLRSEIEAGRQGGRCVASMTPDSRVALQVFLFRYHSRRFPGEPLPDDPDDW